MHIITDALRRCDENTDCVKDYLYSLKAYEGTAGVYGFDENGDVVGIHFVIKKVEKGKPVMVE